MALPLASVVTMASERVAPLLFVRTLKFTVSELAGLPELFITVAVIMELWPAAREVTDPAIETVRLPGAIDAVLVMMITPTAPVAAPCIVSWTLDAGVFAPAV